MMNMHLANENAERRKDLQREADQQRLVQAVTKDEDHNVLQAARVVLGKGLVAVGNQLLKGVER